MPWSKRTTKQEDPGPNSNLLQRKNDINVIVNGFGAHENHYFIWLAEINPTSILLEKWMLIILYPVIANQTLIYRIKIHAS